MGLVRVRYPNGYEAEYRPEIADVLRNRGEVEILPVPQGVPPAEVSIKPVSEVKPGAGTSKPKAGGIRHRGATA